VLGKKKTKRIYYTKIFFFAIRISTQLIENNRKSILIIQGMDASLIGPYLCQTNQSVSTIILQLISMKIYIEILLLNFILRT